MTSGSDKQSPNRPFEANWARYIIPVTTYLWRVSHRLSLTIEGNRVGKREA